MKTYIIAAALTALISIPATAFAQSTTVVVGGQVVGQDPDSNIRGSIIRESAPGQSD